MRGGRGLAGETGVDWSQDWLWVAADTLQTQQLCASPRKSARREQVLVPCGRWPISQVPPPLASHRRIHTQLTRFTRVPWPGEPLCEPAHPGLLGLRGAVWWPGGVPMIALEYAPLGSLEAHLESLTAGASVRTGLHATRTQRACGVLLSA